MNPLNQVHGLWVDGDLSAFAQLTIASFLRHHGQFTLWTYGFPANVPSGAEVRDARLVLLEEEVFAYAGGQAEGSLGGFSDIFRAKLLYLFGGWWVDMDVTLLRPIPDEFLELPIVLRDHWTNPVVGNVMKFPAKHPVMDATYQMTSKAVDATNTDWNKPLRILSCATTMAGLVPRYRRRIAHLDEFIDVLPFVRLPVDLPRHWWAMHWCNEMWRRGDERAKFAPNSHLDRLMKEYGIDSSSLLNLENAK